MTAKDGKPCKRCGTSDWYKRGACKECARKRGREYHLENREAKKEYHREYRLKNREAERKRLREWYLRNREAKKEYDREYRLRNREAKKEYDREYRLRNKGLVREYHREYRLANTSKFKVYRHKRRALKEKNGGSFTAYEWEALCKYYDCRCLSCRKEFPLDQLTADHVIAIANGGTSNIDNIQPLCGPCNSSKGANNTDYRKAFEEFRFWKQPTLPLEL